jgi:GDP-mannose 4,6-dehydratase
MASFCKFAFMNLGKSASPRSPYGAAKLFGYSLTVNYAEAYGMFASNVILFNHESPLRSTEFVTRKVTSAAADYVVNERFPLLLGNLSARRDWGAAREYVDGMWRILQAPAPDAFVLATGRSESIRTLVDLAHARHRFRMGRRRKRRARSLPNNWSRDCPDRRHILSCTRFRRHLLKLIQPAARTP